MLGNLELDLQSVAIILGFFYYRSVFTLRFYVDCNAMPDFLCTTSDASLLTGNLGKCKGIKLGFNAGIITEKLKEPLPVSSNELRIPAFLDLKERVISAVALASRTSAACSIGDHSVWKCDYEKGGKGMQGDQQRLSVSSFFLCPHFSCDSTPLTRI